MASKQWLGEWVGVMHLYPVGFMRLYRVGFMQYDGQTCAELRVVSRLIFFFHEQKLT